MNRKRRSQRLVLEQFESRNLLSAGVGGMHVPAIVSAQPIQLIVPLDGRFHGHFSEADDTVTLKGSGTIRRIGTFTLAGKINTLGVAQGDVVLKGSQGTITVRLTAVAGATGPLGLPVHYSYKIVSGTGMYTNAVDHGTATLTETAAATSDSGHFKLVFKSAFPEPA